MSDVVIPGVDGDVTGVMLVPVAPAPAPPAPAPARANAATPAGTPAPAPSLAPAVIVLPEIDGFCEGTVAAAQRLADAGYVALALDLYAPYGSTPMLRGSGDTMAWLARLNDRRQLSDLVMAISWLQEVPGVDPARIAVLGFSVGGRYAMMLTTEPHPLRAVVAFYSRPWPGGAIAEIALAPGEHVARFGVPVCAVFGADDELIPPEMVETFGGLLLADAAQGHELHVVPGRHFFANVSRPRRYLPESTEAAWAVVLQFLRAHLGTAQLAGVTPSAR
jgi:carboxymethylenebutenolidase